jgi:hypothetical protein
MRRALGAFAAVLSMALIAMTQASAAQVTLTGGQRPFESSYARCDAAVDATTSSTSSTATWVQVANIDAACAGLLVSVMVYDPATGSIRTGGSATAPAGGGALTIPTSGYTPSATDRAFVTIGTWPVSATWAYTPPYPICGVYRLVNGVETARPGSCTVTSLSAAAWWGTAGSRLANVDIAFTYTGASYPDYFKFSVDMRTTSGLPTDWGWATSGVSGGNLVVSSSYLCGRLPVLDGSSVPSWGPTSGFEFRLVENRSTTTVSCSG